MMGILLALSSGTAALKADMCIADPMLSVGPRDFQPRRLFLSQPHDGLPPHLVSPQGHQAVHQVVARRNVREHPPDVRALFGQRR